MRIDIVDVSLAIDQSGEPRVNLGDVTTGTGFAAGVPIFGAGDGFIGIPNGPDGSNQAPQALMGTQGNLRVALAVRDPRFVGKVGQLAEGDRAIVSACDAGLLLTKAANKIGFRAVTQAMEVTLDAANERVQMTAPGTALSLTPSGSQWAFFQSPAIAQVEVLPAAVVLSFYDGATLASITLGPGGTVAVLCTPGTFTVNGIPLA